MGQYPALLKKPPAPLKKQLPSVKKVGEAAAPGPPTPFCFNLATARGAPFYSNPAATWGAPSSPAPPYQSSRPSASAPPPFLSVLAPQQPSSPEPPPPWATLAPPSPASASSPWSLASICRVPVTFYVEGRGRFGEGRKKRALDWRQRKKACDPAHQIRAAVDEPQQLVIRAAALGASHGSTSPSHR